MSSLLTWKRTKDPDDILDYGLDWDDEVDPDSDTIIASSWILPLGITQVSISNTAKGSTIWLSGGVDGKSYSLVNRVITSAGRQMDQTVRLKVQTR